MSQEALDSKRFVEALKTCAANINIKYRDNFEILYDIGNYLGSGVESDVFVRKSNPKQVVKIVRVTGGSQSSFARQWLSILKRIKSKSPHHIARIYEMGKICTINNIDIYFIVGERLQPLNKKEKRDFNRWHDGDPFSQFKLKRVVQFWKTFSRSRFKHQDTHDLNVMKNGKGKLQIVDYGGFHARGCANR